MNKAEDHGYLQMMQTMDDLVDETTLCRSRRMDLVLLPPEPTGARLGDGRVHEVA